MYELSEEDAERLRATPNGEEIYQLIVEMSALREEVEGLEPGDPKILEAGLAAVGALRRMVELSNDGLEQMGADPLPFADAILGFTESLRRETLDAMDVLDEQEGKQ